MQIDFWNIINLRQILNIETLQIMDHVKKKSDYPIYYAPHAWFFKDEKL